jgi:DNA-binding CsgD family transcriptional regulator
MHLAAGHHQAAADDLLELGRRQESVGVRQMIVPWRSNAALALLALGRSEEAGALANEELAIARRWDAPRAVGMATRVVGLIAGGDDLVEHLRQAVEILAASPARLEHARALTDLGSALRRTRHRADARPVLRDAIELATRCGAQALVERAWHELRATGARPRKQVFTGADALTASERRVADMAASGMTNREIAQDLFVTAKTVETHLRQTYMKLDIKSRDQLPAALSNG